MFRNLALLRVNAPKLLVTAQKATIHQVTTMLVTSENALFPGHSHLLTTSTDDPLLAGVQRLGNNQRV